MRNPILGNCWKWKGPTDKNGYGKVWLGYAPMYATLLSWFIYKKVDVPLLGEICHLCNNPKCVNPQHLYHGTRSDNMKYAAYCCRINTQKVDRNVATQIIKDYKSENITQVALAEKYKISRSTIQRVLGGQHV